MGKPSDLQFEQDNKRAFSMWMERKGQGVCKFCGGGRYEGESCQGCGGQNRHKWLEGCRRTDGSTL
jgi:hypothetical protein